MKNIAMPRVAAALIAPTLVVGALLAAPSAQASYDDEARAAAAAWLGDQPRIDGLFTSYYGPTRGESFVDYGLNLDLYVALDDLGNESAAEKVYDAVVAGKQDYTDAYGTRYAGAIGKLATIMQVHGDDTASIVAQAEQLVSADGASTGRARDRDLETQAPSSSDSSNSIGQSWVVRALSGADSDLADEATSYLRKQQCDGGYFRVAMKDAQCTDGTPSVDATAFAVQALDAAPGDQSAAIDEAVEWLGDRQAADGSFDDDGTSNTNSASLAAVVLAAHGRPSEAKRAAGWVADHQVRSGDEEGAIAANDADFAAAAVKPIARVDRDRYVRASVQATLSLGLLDDAKVLKVQAPTTFVAAGKAARVTASGLGAGEKFSVRVGQAAPAYGTANGAGEISIDAPTPAGTAVRTAVVRGSNGKRTGKASVSVLGARTLGVSFRSSSVKKKKTQVVKVSRLVAKEPVTIRFGGKTLKTATAYSNGTFTYSFKVGSSAGKKTVKVTGRFSNRSASKTFTVK